MPGYNLLLPPSILIKEAINNSDTMACVQRKSKKTKGSQWLVGSPDLLQQFCKLATDLIGCDRNGRPSIGHALVDDTFCPMGVTESNYGPRSGHLVARKIIMNCVIAAEDYRPERNEACFACPCHWCR